MTSLCWPERHRNSTMKDERLRVVHGDALDPQKVTETVSGADAVISLLGPQKDGPPESVTRSTANILQGRSDVRRSTGARGGRRGSGRSRGPARSVRQGHQPRAQDRRQGRVRGHEGHGGGRSGLRPRSGRWSASRMLTDDPGKGQPKVGYLGKGAGSRLSRADLAAFMLQPAPRRLTSAGAGRQQLKRLQNAIARGEASLGCLAPPG